MEHNPHIIKVLPTNEDFNLFQQVPSLLYDPRHLKFPSGINEEFASAYFVVLHDDKPVGRVVLYNNPHLQYNGLKAACIGNYECIADENISNELLNAAIHEARINGNEYLIGPMNGSTWDDYRFSLHHNHPNFFLEPYHHLYYNEQFKAVGFEPVSHYISFLDTQMEYKGGKLEKRKQELEAMHVKFRQVRVDDFENELRKVFEFSKKTFDKNFLYTPISWETFYAKYAKIKPLINPSFFLISEDEAGDMIGFIFCIDDILNTESKTLIVKSMARSPERKYYGLSNILGEDIIFNAKHNGYKSIIHAFMIEGGLSGNVSKHFSAQEYKRYTLYGLKL